MGDVTKLVDALYEVRDEARALDMTGPADEEPELASATREALSALAEVLTPGLQTAGIARDRRDYVVLSALATAVAEGSTVLPPLGMRSVRLVLKTLSRWVLASTPLPTRGPLAGARIDLVDSLADGRVLVLLRLQGGAQPEDIATDATSDADLLELCDLATDFAPESATTEVPVIVVSRSERPSKIRLWATNEAAVALVGTTEPIEVGDAELTALKTRFRLRG